MQLMTTLRRLQRAAAQRPESEVLSSCLKLLKARGILAFRMNTGAMHNGSRFVRFGVPGMADILAFPRGVLCPVWIECKSSIGRQSKDQIVFEQIVRNEGHYYAVIRSGEQLNSFLNLLMRGTNASLSNS